MTPKRSSDKAHRDLKRLLANGPLTKGSMYRLNLEKIRDVEAVQEIDPAAVLTEVRNERDQRKRQHAI